MSKKRYYYLDLARNLAILSLPVIHIVEFLSDEMGYSDILDNASVNLLSPITNFLIIFVAPLFMICMGMNMAFTRKNTPKDFAKRGICLLLLEFILNVARYMIPGLIGMCLTNNSNVKSDILNLFIYGQFNSDILAFAGLCFLVFALFKKLKMDKKGILITTIILSLLSEVFVFTLAPIINASLDSTLMNILGNFVYLNADSTFPLIEWLVLPASGLYLGSVLKETKNENKLWDRVGISSLIIMVIYLNILIIFNLDITKNINAPLNDSYMNVFITMFEIAASFFVLFVFYKIFNIFKIDRNEKVVDKITALSRNITYYYCIQWILIGWIMLISEGLEIWGTKIINLPYTLLIILLIMIISQSGASIISKRVRKKQK